MDSRVDRTNRRQTQTPAHQAPPCTLVIFGAGGDLTKRLLMPAIYNLAKAKLLSEKFAIIAVDRTPKPVDAFRDYLAEGIRSFVSDTASAPATEPFDQQAWEFVAARITHFAGDLTVPDTYARLSEAHEKAAAQWHTSGNTIFYLAVASQLFGTIVEQLGAAGLVQEKDNSFRRVIIEKPFGNDLTSARALNAQILRVLSETQTYVAMQLGIDNWRWAGVPFYLRTGKRMTRRTTEIAIQFKQAPFAMFRNTPVDILTPNVLALQIQPDEGAPFLFPCLSGLSH